MAAGDSIVAYHERFWGEKHLGFQVLYENMKHGEEAVNELQVFIKERLTAEEDYLKHLSKTLARLSSFMSASSCLDTGWSLTKGIFDILNDVHIMMVKNLQDMTRELQKYKDEVIRARKEAKQQEMVDSVNLMQTTTTCLQKAKENYHSRWNELEKLRKEPSPNPKDIAKAESKLVKSRDEYRSYVEKYENIRKVFEGRLENACKIFQNHDRTHLTNCVQFLMLFAAHQQEAASSTQQLCGQLRESLQQLSIDDLLTHFVSKYGTGTDRPQPATFEDVELGSLGAVPDFDCEDVPPSDASSSSSAIIQSSLSHPPTSGTSEIVGLDILDVWSERKNSVPIQPSPTASQSSDSTTGPNPMSSVSVLSSSIGGSQKKLSMFLPKRKKTISQSSIGDEEASGGLFKFRRSKKSVSELPVPPNASATATVDVVGMEDTRSTASSSRSEDKQFNGGNLLDGTISRVDDEGFSIPQHDADKEDINWSSCSSDEEDENEMQQSRIRSISIKPAESARAINASVDELRDAIGHISIGSIGRSNTFDKDPWSIGGSKPPLFSQSLGPGVMKPLRPSHTADGRFRTNFNESDFSRSNAPLNFSASLGPVASFTRARPRSNTPTHTSVFGLATQQGVKENGSQDWGSSLLMNHSGSQHSLSESSFNISQSTSNLMQVTINEHRIPLAMAVNEYTHVWFKGADVSKRNVRVFGTVMISFASSSLPILTNIHSDIEPLNFRLVNASKVKSVLPNKQLLLTPSHSSASHKGPVLDYTFDKLGLANWLMQQKNDHHDSAFFNAEVLRYELCEDACTEPPLLMTSYWKCEPEHTDVRIDYRFNTDSALVNPLLNITFSTKINNSVSSVTSEPSATWDSENSTLSWAVTELSRHGECSGSLKARVHLSSAGPSQPVHTYAQFQCSDVTLSGTSIELTSSDFYHLSKVRLKLLSGKYFADPEVRK